MQINDQARYRIRLADWQTPWELFDESDAHQALNSAESAVSLAKELVDTD